ncbi:MAG: RluA family pseudouridine synthase [Deltaproteobacteria bacterium]|nr:RluA family pseudouridine synthase [Deltaproteobacteria bacterium]
MPRPDSGPAPVERVVPTSAARERLDRALPKLVEGLTRSQAKRLIDLGRVTVDGAPAKAGLVLRGGERLRVEPEPPEAWSVEPEPIPVPVLFQDDDLVVVDKPADLVVHPAVGHPRGTLVNALAHLGAAGGDPGRPGIVHRLDRGTSGTMVVARNVEAHARLAAQFARHTVEKLYAALVVGEPPANGRIETLFGRHPVDRKRFSSKVPRGRKALTSFRTLERAPGCARLEVRLGTGRTHQIRVHLSESGWPILGDELYGRRLRDPVLRRAAARLGRPALHAAVLAFDHPRTGARLRFAAPLPTDFLEAWATVRGG